jgi:hypothetical protein
MRSLIARTIPFVALLVIAISLFGLSGCSRPAELPQKNSPEALLYVNRCGTCHRAYDPRSMTAAMWQIQVDSMASRIARAGMPALTNRERAAILDYLTKNAGQN